MKNFLKTCWSVWDKTDRIVAVISSILIIVVCFSMCSCNAQTTISEYTNTYDTILFDFSNIEDVIWSEDDGCFFIEYNDPDAFDYETLAYRTGMENWYGEYILIDIEEDLVPMFLNDWDIYNLSTEINKKWNLNNQYYIQERTLHFSDSTIDYLWEIKFR